MTEIQLFGAGVRVLGVWLFVQGIILAIGSINNLLMNPNADLLRVLTVPVAFFVLSFGLIKGASAITKLVYPAK